MHVWEDPSRSSQTCSRCISICMVLKQMTMILSSEIIVHILSILGTPQEICKASLISSTFRDAANQQGLWEELANRRYGPRVASATKHLYHHSFKLMMQDDNRLGALPSLHGLWNSDWRHNGLNGMHYRCLITCIKWNRANHKILLYLDARGESDLRSPRKSGIWIRDPSTSATETLEQRNLPPRPNADGSYFINQLTNPFNVTKYEYISLLPKQVQGHYQGMLVLDEALFSSHGSYQFCYANPTPNFQRDYDECHLFTIESGQSLMDIFSSFSLEVDSPFDAATLGLGAPSATAVAGQRNLFGPWPECVGMTGEECTNYIRRQNPDLTIQIIPPRGCIQAYYCPSEVRFSVDKNGIVWTPPKRG